MADSVASLTKALEERLGVTRVEMDDVSGGCGQAFQLNVIVAEKFAGMKLLQRVRRPSIACRGGRNKGKKEPLGGGGRCFRYLPFFHPLTPPTHTFSVYILLAAPHDSGRAEGRNCAYTRDID